jgi:hypothetical protein
MIVKEVLVDEINSIYSLQIDGEIKEVVNTGDCRPIDLGNIFFDLKCSELPLSIVLFIEDESNVAEDFIDAVEINRTATATVFHYCLNTRSPENTRNILSEPVLLRKVAEHVKFLNLGLEENYYGEQPYIVIKFSTLENLTIRDKILADLHFIFQIRDKAEKELLAMLDKGIFTLSEE